MVHGRQVVVEFQSVSLHIGTNAIFKKVQISEKSWWSDWEVSQSGPTSQTVDAMDRDVHCVHRVHKVRILGLGGLPKWANESNRGRDGP